MIRLFSWIRDMYRLPATYVQRVAYDWECTNAACCGVSRAEIHDTLFSMTGNGHSRSRRTLLVIQGLWKLAACGVPERNRGMVLEGMSKRYEEWTGYPIPDHYLEKVTNVLVGCLCRGIARNSDLRQFSEVYPQLREALIRSQLCGSDGYLPQALLDWFMEPTLPKHSTR
jgi:hypothetical protein